MGVSRERIRQIQDQALRKVYFHLAKMAKSDGIDLEEFKR
jgi:DNA-directed RNA polymerase sigma subunit (sigma70/sigma32)